MRRIILLIEFAFVAHAGVNVQVEKAVNQIFDELHARPLNANSFPQIDLGSTMLGKRGSHVEPSRTGLRSLYTVPRLSAYPPPSVSPASFKRFIRASPRLRPYVRRHRTFTVVASPAGGEIQTRDALPEVKPIQRYPELTDHEKDAEADAAFYNWVAPLKNHLGPGPWLARALQNLRSETRVRYLQDCRRDSQIEFLVANAEKEGVVVLDSGLQYKVLVHGNGTAHPLAGTPCVCHYEGRFKDGLKFDSSYDRGAPNTFAPNQVIAGWTEALQLMVEGDSWELYVPSELAYGEYGVPGGIIPGCEPLIFKLDLMKIKGESKLAEWFSDANAQSEFMEANALKDGVVVLDSGLQYKVLKNGNGTAHPLSKTPCVCHYEGKFKNGQKFDSSYDRGEPTTFLPNQVIAGWTEALQLMVEGDSWELYIPSDLAYGEEGDRAGIIPGCEDLIFKLELMRIKGASRPAA